MPLMLTLALALMMTLALALMLGLSQGRPLWWMHPMRRPQRRQRRTPCLPTYRPTLHQLQLRCISHLLLQPSKAHRGLRSLRQRMLPPAAGWLHSLSLMQVRTRPA